VKNGLYKLFILFKIAVFKLVKGFVYLVGIYLLSWVLKIGIGFYHIPSASMVPSLEVGDWVFAVKFPYVVRSPEYYPLSKNEFPYYNSGFLLKPKQDDILLFTNPISHQLHPSARISFVKRCIGLPGDTLYILPSGEVLTKMGIYTPEPISYQGYSKVDSLLLVSNQDSLWLSFTKIEKWKKGVDRLKQWRSVKALTKFLNYWHKNVEKIIIPQKEYPITLNQQNKSDWKELIRRDRIYYESKEKSEHALDSILTAGNYRFTQDFYFFIGDNMNLASDSRKWQSVPEKLIIGKVLFRFRWNPLKLKRFKWLG